MVAKGNSFRRTLAISCRWMIENTRGITLSDINRYVIGWGPRSTQLYKYSYDCHLYSMDRIIDMRPAISRKVQLCKQNEPGSASLRCHPGGADECIGSSSDDPVDAQYQGGEIGNTSEDQLAHASDVTREHNRVIRDLMRDSGSIGPITNENMDGYW